MARHRPSPRGVGAILALAAGLAVPGCGREPTGPAALPLITITVTPSRLTLSVGASATLEATVRDADGRVLHGRAVTWASMSPEIVEVSQSGVVTAKAVGIATVAALSDQRAATVGIVVQSLVQLPLAGGRHWLLRTEPGTPAPQCPGGEGGLREDGSRDCAHGGSSRYSIDFAAITLEEGRLTGTRPVQVLAAADGRVVSVCLRPQTEVTCGPNGPSVTVEHPGGLLIIYAHLDPSSVSVRRKTDVVRGQPLGTMAAFPGDTDAWVHIEFRTDLEGPDTGPELRALDLDGLNLLDYRVGPEGPRYYRSSNVPRTVDE